MSGRNILHVSTELGWRGGENQVFLLARGLDGPWRGVVACRSGSELGRRCAAAGIEVRELPPGRGLRAALALRRLAREVDAAVVHAHASHAHGLARLAALGAPWPLVVTRRVDFPLKTGLLAGWKYGKRVDRFVAISEAIRSVLLAGGVANERIALIPSGVDFALLDAAAPIDLRAELSIPAGAPLVGCVAALVDHKDHATLLTAWRQVESSHPQAHLILVGDGELESALRQRAQDLALARIHFLGHRSAVPALLKSLTLFTLSSHLEGLGTSLMDAMRCGLPVVATRAGGIPEVVTEDHDGLLVPIRDPDALARALLRILTDQALANRLATGARHSAEARFSHHRMVAGYAALYDRLAG